MPEIFCSIFFREKALMGETIKRWRDQEGKELMVQTFNC